MTMDSWSALNLSAILVLYTITCIYEKLCKFVYNCLKFGFTWMHMNIYEKLRKFVYNGLDSHGCT
jgi:hypothetical protein